MKSTEYSVTRSRSTFKPRVAPDDLPFYEASDDSIAIGVSGALPSAYSGDARTPVAEPAYVGFFDSAEEARDTSCEFLSLADLPEGVKLDYAFVGSFNNNALKIIWDIDDATYSIDWVALKSFTGMQLKYVLPKKRSPLVFAFSEEDAFAYCDKDPCIECKFRCKVGMIAYLSIGNLGIVRMPLDRMATPMPASSSGI